MSDILVPVSPGEVLDKITILRIKAARITDEAKLANVRTELEALESTWHGSPYGNSDVVADTAALQAVNERLWDIEDRIRDEERAKRFGPEFSALARAVYIETD
jgi:hypothetical protein